MFSPASAQNPCTLSAVISPRSIYALFTSVISSSFLADASSKIFRQSQRLRNPPGSFLIGVIQILQPKLAPIPQQPNEVPRIVPPRHQQHLFNPRLGHAFQRVINHRLVVNRQQVLVGHLGQRKQPAPRPSRQNHAFHQQLQLNSTPKSFENLTVNPPTTQLTSLRHPIGTLSHLPASMRIWEIGIAYASYSACRRFGHRPRTAGEASRL